LGEFWSAVGHIGITAEVVDGSENTSGLPGVVFEVHPEDESVVCIVIPAGNRVGT